MREKKGKHAKRNTNLVQFGVENAISDELTLLANDSDHWKFNSEKGRGCK